MLTALDIVLIALTLIAAVLAAQFLRLRIRDREYRSITSQASPSTVHALADLERLRRRPDEVFFIRLVQDLKSPLTLLEGPVEQLQQSKNLSPDDRKMLRVMRNAVRRMDRIVSQLSDFSQQEYHDLRLALNKDYPVCARVRQDLEYFRSNAALLGVTVLEEGTDGELCIPLDIVKFESVLYNLLYEALKFVFRGGEVRVRAGTIRGAEVSRLARTGTPDPEEEFFLLNVFHSGETLNEDALEAIFGKEYIYLDSRAFAGVGLYYVRALVEAHKGYIWAANDPGGDGVNFTFAIPMDESAYAPSDFSVSAPVLSVTPWESENLADSGDEAAAEGLPFLLVVEEDEDLLSYLTLLLQNEYRIAQCRSNTEAREILDRGVLPDLVIADSANSRESALEFCRQLHRDDITCRIPFIMLTREKKDEGNIDAMEAGADATLEHPFKPAMVPALVKSLLRRRNLAKGHVIAPDDMVFSEGEASIVSDEDRALFDALCQVIRDNAGNPELTVPLLCEMLHISRTKLYNKVNDMIGMSPKRFIHEYRLKIAAQMLAEGQMTVGEIADATGYSSQSYFSKAFRKQYRRMPSEIKHAGNTAPN